MDCRPTYIPLPRTFRKTNEEFALYGNERLIQNQFKIARKAVKKILKNHLKKEEIEKLKPERTLTCWEFSHTLRYMVDGPGDHKDTDIFSYFKNSYWSLSLLHYLPGVMHEHVHAILSKVIDYNKREMREAVEEIDIVTRSYVPDFVTLPNRATVFLEECLSDIVSASLFGEAYFATLFLEIAGLSDSYLFQYHIPSLSPMRVPWWVRLKVARNITFPREVPVNSFIGQLDKFLRRFHTDMLAFCHEEYYEDGMRRVNYDKELSVLIEDVCLDIFGRFGRKIYPGAALPLEINYEGDILLCRCENVSRLFRNYNFFEKKLGFSKKDKKELLANLLRSVDAKYSGDYNLPIEYVLWMFHLCSLYNKDKQKDALSLSSADAFHSMAAVFIEGPSFFKKEKDASAGRVIFSPPEGVEADSARAVLFIKWRWDEPYLAVADKSGEEKIDLISRGICDLLEGNNHKNGKDNKGVLAVAEGYLTFGAYSALIFSDVPFSGRKFYHKWPPPFYINRRNIPYFSERMVLRLYRNVLITSESEGGQKDMQNCRPKVNTFIQVRLRSTSLYKNRKKTKSSSRYIPPIEKIQTCLHDMWQNGDKIYTCLSWSQVYLFFSSRTLHEVFKIKNALQMLDVIDRTQTTLLYPSGNVKDIVVPSRSIDEKFSVITKLRLNRIEGQSSLDKTAYSDGDYDAKVSNTMWSPGIFDHHIRWKIFPSAKDILGRIEAMNRKYNGDWIVFGYADGCFKRGW